METSNLSIMFTDIKGFTKRVNEGTREDMARLTDLHDSLLIPIFEKHKGKIIKTIGDAFLVTFNSPTNAVVCGVDIQKILAKHNAETEDPYDLQDDAAIILRGYTRLDVDDLIFV